MRGVCAQIRAGAAVRRSKMWPKAQILVSSPPHDFSGRVTLGAGISPPRESFGLGKKQKKKVPDDSNRLVIF